MGAKTDWSFEPIGTLLDEIIDYRGKTPPKSAAGIPLISAANVKRGRVVLADPEFISPNDYKSWTRRGFTQPGDVLITTEAPAGEVAPYPREGTYQISRRVMALRPNKAKLDPDFLLYALLWPEVNQRLLSYSRGTTVPRVLKTDVTGLPIPLPPLPEQKAIADILGSLDAKIELNRRMNETLESLARAIFKSWFVDFDPVRAKMDGRQPTGMDEATAALFPDSFEHVDRGLVPVGWRVGQLRELCERVENGGTPKRNVEEYWNPGEIPWLTSGEVRQPFVVGTENLISELGLSNSSAKLWPRHSTVVALYGATAGIATLLGCEVSANQACCALVPKAGATAFNLLRLRFGFDELVQQARGSAQQNLSQSIVADVKTILPSLVVLESFDARIVPLFDRCVRNLRESRTLATLRDTLLPKLLSGELRVADAMKQVTDTMSVATDEPAEAEA
jgi:type I restriction enzyme S subunit